ncbi:MAG: endonuclease V, partial [Halothiobacillaceae bacterium]
VGVGKTRLCGRHTDVPDVRGAWAPLEDKGEVIGAVLRTRAGVKPVYVSIGHRMDLQAAVASVMAALTRYRLPAPIRAAHQLASNSRPLQPGMVIR